MGPILVHHRSSEERVCRTLEQETMVCTPTQLLGVVTREMWVGCTKPTTGSASVAATTYIVLTRAQSFVYFVIQLSSNARSTQVIDIGTVATTTTSCQSVLCHIDKGKT